MALRGRKLLSAYQWLIDGLKPHCDSTHAELFDYDTALGVCASWGEGEERYRYAIRPQFCYHEGGTWVEAAPDEEYDYCGGRWEGGEWKEYSLNALIESGETTRERVIESILSKRPVKP